jgi:hypothetical protein
MAKKKRKILLDADVVIHFVNGENFILLPTLFKEEKVILDKVCNELRKRRDLRQFYDNVVAFGLIKEITFDGDLDIIKEYARLKKKYGDGESACMAYCKYNKDILASSNLSDIKEYCEENGIEYITTMGFLYEAYQTDKLTGEECDEFISKVLASGSKLPVKNMNEYLDNL